MKRLILVIIAIWILCSGMTFVDETFNVDWPQSVYDDVYCDECGSTNLEISIEYETCDFNESDESMSMSEYSNHRIFVTCGVWHGSKTILTCLDCGYKVEKVE